MRSVASVLAWLDDVRRADAGRWDDRLSGPNARAGVDGAVDALSREALDAVGLDREPWTEATVVGADGAFVAPLEWVTLLLLRGTRVRLKVPRDRPAFGRFLADVARVHGLPLEAADTVDSVRGAPFVVVMGGDDAVQAIRRVCPGRVVGLGHRTSFQWIVGRDPTVWRGVAEDHARFDTRGCMAPVVVFAPEDPGDLLDAALEDAEQRWPLGTPTPGESAAIRARGAWVRAKGGAVRVGRGWAVHVVRGGPVPSHALPRVVHLVIDVDAPLGVEGPVSTVGTDASAFRWEDARVCAPGAMQTPPLHRLHDGIDLVACTAGR